VDTGDREPAALLLEKVPLSPVEQGRRGWQDAGGANQGWAQSQKGDQETSMIG